jgi:hypothetical protein
MKIYTREQNCYKNMQITIIGVGHCRGGLRINSLGYYANIGKIPLN